MGIEVPRINRIAKCRAFVSKANDFYKCFCDMNVTEPLLVFVFYLKGHKHSIAHILMAADTLMTFTIHKRSQNITFLVPINSTRSFIKKITFKF